MHALTQFVVGLSALVLAGSEALIAQELKTLRQTLGKRRCRTGRTEWKRHRQARLAKGRENFFHTSTLTGPMPDAAHQAGFAIYMFRNNRWVMEADLSAPGCECTPPSIPGSFEGQVIRKESSARN